MCFKTYLNHPINQKTLQKRITDHSSQKRGGWVRRGMIMITDSMGFFTRSLISCDSLISLAPSQTLRQLLVMPFFCLGAVHKLCQPKMGGSRPPLPPLSAIVSISRTPPPPFVIHCQHFPNPPSPLCQVCQHLPNPPFVFRVSFVKLFNADHFLKNLFF